MCASFSRQELENWLKTLEIKGSVLDVGGSQNPIRERTKSWDVSEYKILDLEQPHQCKQEPDIITDLNYSIAFLHKHNKHIIGTKNQFKNYWSLNEKEYQYRQNNKQIVDIFEMNKYDNIFCLEVMEYVWRPWQFLYGLSRFIKKGGIFYSSWHTLYGLHPPEGEDCLRYTKNVIEKLMKKTGFKILEMIPRTIRDESKLHLQNFYRSEGMRLDYSDPETYVEGYLVKCEVVK